MVHSPRTSCSGRNDWKLLVGIVQDTRFENKPTYKLHQIVQWSSNRRQRVTLVNKFGIMQKMNIRNDGSPQVSFLSPVILYHVNITNKPQ